VSLPRPLLNTGNLEPNSVEFVISPLLAFFVVNPLCLSGQDNW
jgi:hypothetical protein